MRKPSSYEASDYAGLVTDNAKFYYGYEDTWCPEHGFSPDCECDNKDWVFAAEIEGRDPIRIPFRKLGAEDRFECRDCLLMGIGWVLTKYKLDLSDKGELK